MKKSVAILLTLVFVLSLALCGCGAKENLVGTWKTTVELAEAMNQEMVAADPQMGEYMKVESFALPLILELKEDGTYVMSVDAAAATETMNKFADDMAVGMEQYFAAMLGEMGIEMDVNEFLAASGISMDELINEVKNQFANEETFAEFASEGQYKAENGKLHMSESLEEEVSAISYNTYTLEGDTLTLEAGTESAEEYAEYMFPMTLTRVK